MADEPVLTPNLKVLLEKAHAELMAMPASQIVQRKITRGRVLALTKVMRASCLEIVHLLDNELKPERVAERKAQMANLPNRARVFYAADLASEEIDSDPNKVQNDALAVMVKEYDHKLFKWATPLFGDDPIKAATLRDIARGTGKRDDADDVLRLVKMYRDNWAMAAGKTEVDEKLLDEAEAAALKQLEELDAAKVNPAKDLAARAYSAWHHDYVQLRRLGFYVVGHLPDVGKRFPGISSNSSRRADEPPVKLEDLEEDEENAQEENEEQAEDEESEGEDTEEQAEDEDNEGEDNEEQAEDEDEDEENLEEEPKP